MELQYFGANCLRINGKNFTVAVDDNLDQLGAKTITKPNDIALRTHTAVPAPKEARFTADMPGEYEAAGAVINGVAARAHMDEEGKSSATIFTIEAEDVRIVILGHIFPDLSDEQVEQIGMVDVAIIPVGGNGYTLDGVGALSVIKKIEPKIVIPTHYADKSIKYEVPQAILSDALKAMGMEPSDTESKYKVRPGEASDATKLIILERQ